VKSKNSLKNYTWTTTDLRPSDKREDRDYNSILVSLEQTGYSIVYDFLDYSDAIELMERKAELSENPIHFDVTFK